MILRGRSPEPSPRGHAASGVAAALASSRRAAHSDAPELVGVGEPTPLAGSRHSLDAARRSNGRAVGDANAFPSIERVQCVPPISDTVRAPVVPTPEGAASRWISRVNPWLKVAPTLSALQDAIQAAGGHDGG